MLPSASFPAAQTIPAPLTNTPPPIQPVAEAVAPSLIFQTIAANPSLVEPYNNVRGGGAATSRHTDSEAEHHTQTDLDILPSQSAAPFGQLLQASTAYTALEMAQKPGHPPFPIRRNSGELSLAMGAGSAAYQQSNERSAAQLSRLHTSAKLI